MWTLEADGWISVPSLSPAFLITSNTFTFSELHFLCLSKGHNGVSLWGLLWTMWLLTINNSSSFCVQGKHNMPPLVILWGPPWVWKSLKGNDQAMCLFRSGRYNSLEVPLIVSVDAPPSLSSSLLFLRSLPMHLPDNSPQSKQDICWVFLKEALASLGSNSYCSVHLHAYRVSRSAMWFHSSRLYFI